MTFISNPSATLAFTSGNTTVNVTGTNPILEGVRVGDLAVHPSGALPIAAVSATTITLVLPAPSNASPAFNIMWGPSRSLVAQATSTTREVWAQITRWAGRGLSYPVIARQNTPPSSPADTDTYLVGTAGTGAWSGNSNRLAIWSSASSRWEFAVPSNGDQVTLNGTAIRLQWTGSAWATTAVLASDVTSTATGGVTATNVQTAIEQLEANKAALTAVYDRSTADARYARLAVNNNFSGNVLAAFLRAVASGVGSADLVVGSSTTSGGLQVSNAAGTRVAYFGFASATAGPQIASENGFPVNFTARPTFAGNTSLDTANLPGIFRDMQASGGIGSIVKAAVLPTNQTAIFYGRGDTVAGSLLAYTPNAIQSAYPTSPSAGLSGTWQALDAAYRADSRVSNDNSTAALWVRIA